MHIQVFVAEEPVADFDLSGPVSVGRQSVERYEPGPIRLLPPVGSGPARLIVAASDTAGVSRSALTLTSTGPDTVRIHNTSRWPLVVRTTVARSLEQKETLEATLPASVLFATFELRLTATDEYDHLELPSIAPMAALRTRPPIPPAFSKTQLNELVGWMQHTVAVLQSTLASSDFVPAAAEALVNIVHLDSGRVFLRQENKWSEVTRFPAGADVSPPSGTVLELARTGRQTVWKVNAAANSDGDVTAVLSKLAAVVAAPILNAEEEVVGVLYGERRQGERRLSAAIAPVGKLEALLVDMLACGIATGLNRQRHTLKAEQAERRFAQFFGPELATELARNPNLLEGRVEQVSIVFADVREFSRISEKLSPAETVKWLGDIINELSDAVTAEGGVVVDYVGDEVVAMWGAPKPQADHAARATRAALAMLARLPALNARWADRIGEECRLGVGVNTGSALVGNIGSTQKFKYGPLGNTVNLASRVQGMTRFLKVPLLVTGATKAALGAEFLARRVCQTRVRNISQPVELFEVVLAASGDAEFFRQSEAALVALETGQFAEAARRAGGLLGEHPGNGPLQLVLSRAAAAILEDGKGFDTVWTPPGK